MKERERIRFTIKDYENIYYFLGIALSDYEDNEQTQKEIETLQKKIQQAVIKMRKRSR